MGGLKPPCHPPIGPGPAPEVFAAAEHEPGLQNPAEWGQMPVPGSEWKLQPLQQLPQEQGTPASTGIVAR